MKLRGNLEARIRGMTYAELDRAAWGLFLIVLALVIFIGGVWPVK